MTKSDILDDIIAAIEPEHIPPEFIVMAKIRDFSGEERIVRGPELEAIMIDPENYEVASARVILNVRKIRAEIIDEVQNIYERAYRLGLD